MYSPSIEQLFVQDRYGDERQHHIFKENKLKLTKHMSHLPSFAAAVGNGLQQNNPLVKTEPLPANFKKRRVEEVFKMMCQNRMDTTTVSSQKPTHNESTGIAKPIPATKQSHSNGDYPIVLGESLNSSTERYEVESFLGRGTFGQVVKCRCLSNGNMAAVKILKNHPSYLRQGNIEIQILQTLNREDTEASNIVRAIECFEHNKHMCLVFELLGQNLYEYLKANKFRPMAVTDIRQITQQVLLALAKLKTLGLIHADLKPENIMLVDSDNGFPGFRVKVIDFGSACYSAKAVQNTYLQSRYYRAPEILLGLPFNEAIDMWSLGCVIAELFLGWPLYPGASEYDQVRYIVDTQGLPPVDLINRASKSSRFFVCEAFNYTWRLRTPAEQLNNNNNNNCDTPGQNGAQPRAKEPRKYIFNSLDQIAMATTMGNGSGGEFEIETRRQMASLLAMMLQWNGTERVAPNLALRHPFITAAYSIKCPEQVCVPPPMISQSNPAPPTHPFWPGTLGPLIADPPREMLQPSASMGGHFQHSSVNSTFDPAVGGSLPMGSAGNCQPPAQHQQPHHYTNLNQQDPNLLMLQHVISPAATALAIRSLIPGIDACGPNRQGFVPATALAHSLLMSASEGVPLPPSDPWRDTTPRGSQQHGQPQPPDPWALALAAAALGRHYYANLPADLLFRQQASGPPPPQIADMAPSTPLLHPQHFNTAATNHGYLLGNQLPPPSLHPAPGLMPPHHHHPHQFAQHSGFQPQQAHHPASLHREMSCPSNMGGLGTANFPIYVSSSESDGSPMDSNALLHGLAMNQMGQCGTTDIWEMKDKKSIPVGRVQPILKGPPIPSPQCGQLDTYHNMFMRMPGSGQPMGGLHPAPAHFMQANQMPPSSQQQSPYFNQNLMTDNNLTSAMLDPYIMAYGSSSMM